MISSEKLQTLRADFRESKKHAHLPEASLIAGKESTAMFNLAGMQQLIPYLSGKEHPLGKRLYNIQKVVRTIDIDEVGDASHLTMFGMMGNRSLGDYFKKESIARSWEFLTDQKRLGLDPKKIAVTVFQGDENVARDEESADYRKSVCMTNISYLGADDNRRSPGPVGPCGPDTEIFYWVGDTKGGAAFPPADSTVENDSANWMEIRNNVFMEFYRDESGKLTKLPAQNVDTGMGFERMYMVLQEKSSPYDTDLFQGAIHILEKTLSTSYEKNPRRMRIIVDHCRTTLSLIAENLQPSNEARGYVLRMLIRRMYYNIVLLRDIPLQEIDALCEQLVSFFGFTESHKNTLLKEIIQFQKTLINGQKELEKLIGQKQAKGLVIARKEQSDGRGNLEDRKGIINGSDIFKLYDTFGFPFELTRELAQEKGLMIDEAGFYAELEKQKDRSRKGSKDMFAKGTDRSTHIQGIPATQFTGYESLQIENTKLLKDFSINGQRILIFDKTPFYAEGGGQTGDRGVITIDSGEEVTVTNVKKYEGVFLHFIE